MCQPDRTEISCVSGQCRDCYAQLKPSCTAADAVCAPKIYIAWLGTDKHGQPLLSAGSVLSRFTENSVVGLARQVVEVWSSLPMRSTRVAATAAAAMVAAVPMTVAATAVLATLPSTPPRRQRLPPPTLRASEFFGAEYSDSAVV